MPGAGESDRCRGAGRPAADDEGGRAGRQGHVQAARAEVEAFGGEAGAEGQRDAAPPLGPLRACSASTNGKVEEDMLP